ncbi:MAG: carbon-nitrogen hydrolase family protein [Pseudomonadota bacterium]
MKLGVFQPAFGGLLPDERIERLGAVIAETSVDLVICPELFLSGYNVGKDLTRFAQPAEGPRFKLIAELARAHQTAILYGYPELEAGTLYNSAACVGPDGALIANHRKRANSPASFEEDYFTPGKAHSVFDYAGLRIAILICYEVEFPEAVRQAAQSGAHLVVVPTALVEQWDVVASRVVPARAFENGVWVAYCNHAGREGNCVYLGGSRIVAPDGQEAAVAGREEALICADVDTDRVAAAQQRLPYLRDCGRFAPA